MPSLLLGALLFNAYIVYIFCFGYSGVLKGPMLKCIYIQNFLLKCWIKEGFKPPSVYFSLSVSHLGGRWGIPFTSCANDVTRRVKPQKVGENLLLDRCHWKSEA